MQIRLPSLALEPRGDITRSPEQGYQWPHKKDLCPPKFRNFLKNFWQNWIYIFSSSLWRKICRYFYIRSRVKRQHNIVTEYHTIFWEMLGTLADVYTLVLIYRSDIQNKKLFLSGIVRRTAGNFWGFRNNYKQINKSVYRIIDRMCKI